MGTRWVNSGWENGAACKTRTCDPRIHHTTTFVATPTVGVFVRWTSLHHTNVGLDAHRQVSTPFPFGTWLGIAILQVSPTLMSVHLKVSL